MKRISLIGLIIALLAPLAMLAQDPSIKVSAKRQVSVGEQFKIAFEVNADGKKFRELHGGRWTFQFIEFQRPDCEWFRVAHGDEHLFLCAQG